MFKEYPAKDPAVVLLFIHGMGAHGGRWDSCAEFFARNGIASAAIDLRGFGRTTQARGHIDSFSVYVDDVVALRGVLKEKYPQAKVTLVGESMGALIACQAALREPGLFHGLVCLAPAFKAKVKVPLGMAVSAAVLSVLNPYKQYCLPFSPGMLTRDLPYQEKMGSDQREQRCVSAGLLGNFLKAQAQVKRGAPLLSVPLLFILAGSDVVVSNAAARSLFKKISYQDKKLIEHPHMFHALSIDVGKEKVFEDILSWMKTHALYTRH